MRSLEYILVCAGLEKDEFHVCFLLLLQVLFGTFIIVVTENLIQTTRGKSIVSLLRVQRVQNTTSKAGRSAWPFQEEEVSAASQFSVEHEPRQIWIGTKATCDLQAYPSVNYLSQPNLRL